METHNEFIVNLLYKKERYLWEKLCIFKDKLLMSFTFTNDSALRILHVYEKVEIDKMKNGSDIH